jgi:hypothetical protein
MKKCIAILILTLPVSTYAFEHLVVAGDSLWILSAHYLGSGLKWRQITYLNGRQPLEQSLTVGRFVTDEHHQKGTIVNLSHPVPAITTHALPRATVTLPHNTSSLSFNTAFYCCAKDVVSMDEYGHFQITPQSHPFFTALDTPIKQNMSSFMNINISEDLLNAFNEN